MLAPHPAMAVPLVSLFPGRGRSLAGVARAMGRWRRWRRFAGSLLAGPGAACSVAGAAQWLQAGVTRPMGWWRGQCRLVADSLNLYFGKPAVVVAVGRGCPTAKLPLLVADSPHSNTIDDRIARPAAVVCGPSCLYLFHAPLVVADSPVRLPLDAASPVCLPLDAPLFPHNEDPSALSTQEYMLPTIYVGSCHL